MKRRQDKNDDKIKMTTRKEDKKERIGNERTTRRKDKERKNRR